MKVDISFCSGLAVRLVPRDSRDGLRVTSTDSSELSDYKTNFKILHDSAYALMISFGRLEDDCCVPPLLRSSKLFKKRYRYYNLRIATLLYLIIYLSNSSFEKDIRSLYLNKTHFNLKTLYFAEVTAMGNCISVSRIKKQRSLPISNLSMASSSLSSHSSAPASNSPIPNLSIASSSTINISQSASASSLPLLNLSMTSSSSSSQSAPASYPPLQNFSMASSSLSSPSSAPTSYSPIPNLSIASSSSISQSASTSYLPLPNLSMASSSLSSQSSAPTSYDVFLSFRGEDTRKTFVDHLYSALKQRLIHTYKDDETLPRGVSIGPSLLKAIKQSSIALIIFSKNYADSSWCLDELEFIMKCNVETGLIVMPIFYDVDPSEVRKQKGDFGEGFAKQKAKNITKIESWRKALVDASNISGWEPKNIANGHESKFIKEIADKIFDRLFPSVLDIDDGLVGMRTRLQEMKAQLEMASGEIRMLGIWGVGGGGKTTLATSVYMEISHQFEGSCIVENIRGESSKNGLEQLQDKLLSSIFKRKVEVHSITEGKNMIKTMLRHRKVLILLDDVDKLDQLQALAGSHNWFGGGSRIIITTRDEHLLRVHKVNQVYPVRLLSDDEARLLFKIHAYNEGNPIKDYEKLSLRVVSYASGLPLAVKVLGSFLYDKDEKEWMSALDRLKDVPEMEIVRKLKISYDGLNTLEKDLFLDIACFFRGMSMKSKHDGMEILEACGYHPCIGIKILREKALITINRDGKFDMHDLIQEMGHFIVRGEDPDNPEKHSRVWKHNEIRNMCSRGAIMQNDKIKAIRYCGDDHRGHTSPFCMIVSNLKQLRWLKVYIMEYKYDEIKAPTFLSNELRYINWKHYPTSPFPESFQPVKMVVIKLEYSLQKELWMGYKHLPHLKVLQLSRMENLLRTPDFRGLPCLQKFVLERCPRLEEIHPSLGNHSSLEYLKVSRCDRLQMFPTIVQMDKLKTLKIDECHKISKFPKIQANMKSLVKLSLDHIGIEVLPSSIAERCSKLETFLRKLGISYCHLKDGKIPSHIGELSTLQELALRGNDFTRVHFSLTQLTQLRCLDLSDCERLVELPKLPSSLAILEADQCTSLATVGDCHTDCKRLCIVSITYGATITDGSRLLESMLQGNPIEDHYMHLAVRSDEIPKGFIPRLCKGSKRTLQLPNNWRDDFCGLLMCAVFSHDFNLHTNTISIEQPISDEGMDSGQNDVVWEERMGSTSTWVGYISFGSLRHTCWWDHTHDTRSLSIDVLYCNLLGVRLVPRNSRDGRLRETSTDSSELSDYKPRFKILHDSAYALKIFLSQYKKSYT
uniref:disease resistance protein Roq1-like n=1 Tax=Erigeron canadensis TaxID=72917 RepID=UPI001CB962BC|nr:disease resistance protein Roq1-like [Erigeron canadensis]